MDSAKIMIVEDKTMVAEDCRDCLEGLGYTVSSIVASGEESIIKAKTDRPDAVLMDIQLRDKMDGIEAAEQIYTHLKIPIIFLSAYCDRNLLERAKQVGSFGYLIKPIDERELLANLEMALYKANMEKERRQMESMKRQSKKMAAVATLAGGIAHQFNNNLTVITLGIEMLQMKLSGDEIIDRYLEGMRDATCRMAELAAQLLTFARGGKFFIKTIALGQIINDVISLIKPKFDPDIQVHAVHCDEGINVKADPNQMQMALSVILTNASEAIDRQGCIRITCSRKSISERIARDFPGLTPGDYACLTVTDDGKGMDEETKMRIFEPFFTTKFPGRGLGMSAAYGFVKNHDGYIMVDSELNKGTTVTIYLPER